MKHLIPLILALLILPAFHPVKPQPTYKTRPIVVGHRGAMLFAPENTIASIEKAIEMGADMIEMDIRQTKDGYLVLMHDASLKRTTNGTGKVEDVSLEYLMTLDAGSHFRKEYEGEMIPTLRQALQALKGKGLPDIDFKKGDPKLLVKILEEEGFLEDGNVTMHTGNQEYIEAVQELTDKILLRPSCYGGIAALDDCMEKRKMSVVNVNWRSFSREYADAIHKRGLKVFVNTLGRASDKPKNMKKALAAGADYIQTDHLDELMPLLQDR